MPSSNPEAERVKGLTERTEEMRDLLSRLPDLTDVSRGGPRDEAIEYHRALGDLTVRLNEAIQKVRRADATYYADARMPHGRLTEEAQEVLTKAEKIHLEIQQSL